MPLAGGDRILLCPALVGRSAGRLRDLAERHGIADWTTDLSMALADPDAPVYFDARSPRPGSPP